MKNSMGNPAEMEEANVQAPSSHTKATFSGTTAFIGVLALIITIISVAVPHWGSYAPVGQQYFAAGYASQDNTGHFGPFQVCIYHAYYSYCGGNAQYRPTTWLVIAGICAIAGVISLAFFSLFAILHVAMQLQRRVIWISFQRSVFLKVLFGVLATLATLGAVILGAVEFSFSGRSNALRYKIGVCYYLQIFLIFVNALLVILSYLSYKRARKYPIHLVPRGRASDYVYDNHGSNGVSMTNASGQPYAHGMPRYPIQPQPSANSIRTAHQYTANAMTSYANGHTLPTVHFSTTATQPGPQVPVNNEGHVNNGFTAVNLHAASNNNGNGGAPPQPLPIQAIRPIQAVAPQIQIPTSQGIQASTPQGLSLSNLPQVLPVASAAGGSSNGVSFTPQGRAGYTKMNNHTGSMESLDSTQSLTLSSYSLGSSTSTGSAHGPLRSSLKKAKNRDIASVSSKSSSKQVRISLGAEQTTV